MTLVQPPFLLDFASAYLDNDGPDFPSEVMDEWLARKSEEFGPNWGRVPGVLAALHRLGIVLTDIHPGNIDFGGADD